MPRIDATRGVLVLRIVYDGPAMSGKTTSLRALGAGVARSVISPDEREGRTVFFDWLEYVGGLFEGRQICCQIVSVPGQRELAHRRRLLLEGADAVVCVLDTTRPEFEFGLAWLRDVQDTCRSKEPPVGLVLQANKRDMADAVPREELSEHVLAAAPVAIVEAVATSSDGIREAFVLAVRLALDRVRALAAEGRLETSAPADDGADALLRAMREAEISAQPAPVPNADTPPADPLLELFQRVHPVDRSHLVSNYQAAERVFSPDANMPGGMIWPPVDGRTLLHEVSLLDIRPSRTPRGDWWGSGSGWRFHSSPDALFDSPASARDALLGWARLHASNAGRISLGRAVILADAGEGRLRLWQLVKVEVALRERLVAAFAASDPGVVADAILAVTDQLLVARDWFEQGAPTLPCTLWTVGAAPSMRPVFVGLMPAQSALVALDRAPGELLEREIAPQLRELRRSRIDFAEILREVVLRSRSAQQGGAGRALEEVVAKVA